LLQADSLTVPVTAHLWQVYFRLDYDFLEGKQVSPVVSAGGGAYRIRTGGDGSGIWNTSLYWMLGAGLDVSLSPKMTIEVRATTQLLEEINSGRLNGHVGNLFVVGAGFRFEF
jgi:opacity protein-like surface antigen